MAGEGLIMEAFSGLDDRFSFSKLTREEEIAEVAFYDKYFNHQPEEEEAAFKEEVALLAFLCCAFRCD